jgi:hypothetical protein
MKARTVVDALDPIDDIESAWAQWVGEGGPRQSPLRPTHQRRREDGLGVFRESTAASGNEHRLGA